LKTVTISFSLPDRERLRALLRRRGTGLVLALIAEALILLMLLTFTPRIAGTHDKGSLLTFGFDQDKSQDKQDKHQKAEQKHNKATEKPKQQPPQPTPKPTNEPPLELPPTVVRMNRQDFQSADIARFSRSQSAAAAPSDAQGNSDVGPDSAVVGKGPHGEPVYAAEWYTRPTHTQLDTYISDRSRQRLPGAGLIQCRTIENYRVDDCRDIDETPVGSGLSEAVRQAAWQFRVRPPRVGGKYQVGAWVQIEISYYIDRVVLH
jgi:protein TonB